MREDRPHGLRQESRTFRNPARVPGCPRWIPHVSSPRVGRMSTSAKDRGAAGRVSKGVRRPGKWEGDRSSGRMLRQGRACNTAWMLYGPATAKRDALDADCSLGAGLLPVWFSAVFQNSAGFHVKWSSSSLSSLDDRNVLDTGAGSPPFLSASDICLSSAMGRGKGFWRMPYMREAQWAHAALRHSRRGLHHGRRKK